MKLRTFVAGRESDRDCPDQRGSAKQAGQELGGFPAEFDDGDEGGCDLGTFEKPLQLFQRFVLVA